MLSPEKGYKKKEMTLSIILFLVSIAIIFLAVIFKLIRKNYLPPSSALFWLCVGIIILSIPLLYRAYRYIASNLLGFVDATNIIYIISISFLAMYALYITVKLKQSSDRIQILISHLAIVEAENDRRLTNLEKLTNLLIK